MAREGDYSRGIGSEGGAGIVAVEFFDFEAVSFEEDFEFAWEDGGESEGDAFGVLVAVGVVPAVEEGDALELSGGVADDGGAAKDGAIEFGNVEEDGVEVVGARAGEQREVGVEDVEPEFAGGLEVANDGLEELVLGVEGGKGEQCVEEEDDPVEFFTEAEIQDVGFDEGEIARGDFGGVAFLAGDFEHVGGVVDADDSVASLGDGDGGAGGARGEFEDGLSAFGEMAEECGDVEAEHVVVPVFGVVVGGDGAVGFHFAGV
jgi:hypothetical protein